MFTFSRQFLLVVWGRQRMLFRRLLPVPVSAVFEVRLNCPVVIGRSLAAPKDRVTPSESGMKDLKNLLCVSLTNSSLLTVDYLVLEAVMFFYLSVILTPSAMVANGMVEHCRLCWLLYSSSVSLSFLSTLMFPYRIYCWKSLACAQSHYSFLQGYSGHCSHPKF